MKKSRNIVSKLALVMAVITVVTALPMITYAEDQPQSVSASEAVSGEYTVEQLQSMRVPDEDIPEMMAEIDINSKGHAVRLKSEEPDASTVIFKNRDGSKTAYIYTCPIKYTDADGNVRDKSSDITAYSGTYGEKNYAYAMNDNDVKAYFSRVGTEGVKLSAAGYDIEMIPVNTSTLLIPSATLVDENTIRYNDVYGLGTSIEYSTMLNGVKEDIVLSRYAGVNSFSFMLYTDGLALLNNGEDHYLANAAGERVASLGRVIAEDNSGKTAYGTMSAKAVKAGAQYLVNISVDSAFLTASDTVYPVRIDPTVTIDQGDTGYMNRIEDTGLYTSSSSLEGLEDDQYPIGYVSSTVGVGRMAIRFPMFVDPWADNMLSSYGYLSDLKGYQISSATLSLYARFVNGSTTVKVTPMTQVPSFTVSGRVQSDTLFNAYNDTYATTKVISSAGRYGIDVTEVVKLWSDFDFDIDNLGGTLSPISGLMIRNQNESDEMKTVTFYSAMYYDPNYQPYLSVTYDTTFDGVEYYINNSGTGKFLKTSGTNAQIGVYSSGNLSKWYFDSAGSGKYFIRNANDNSKVLYSNNGTVSVGTIAYGSLPSTVANKYKWTIDDYGDGYYLISNEADDKILYTDSTGLKLITRPNTGITVFSGHLWRILKSDSYKNLTSFSISDIDVQVGCTESINLTISPGNATWADLTDFDIELSNAYGTVAEIYKVSRTIFGIMPVERSVAITHKVTGVTNTFNLKVFNLVNIIAVQNNEENQEIDLNDSLPLYRSNLNSPTSIVTDPQYSNFTVQQINNYLTTSNIFIIVAHGGVSESSTFMEINKDAYGNPIYYDSSHLAALENGALDKLKLVTFLGCSVGATVSNQNNLPQVAVAKGADTAIGFKVDVQTAIGLHWMTAFSESYSTGSTIQQACNYACSQTVIRAAELNQNPETPNDPQYIPISISDVLIVGSTTATINSAISIDFD